MLVTVGNEYAERLGYTEIVGAMVAPGQQLEVLVEVQVVAGPKELIGKLFDIHKNDMEPIPEEREEQYYFVCDYDTEQVFYTKDKELADFVRRDMHARNHAVRAYNVTMAEVMEHYNKYTIHLLEDEGNPTSKSFMKSWALKQDMQKQMEAQKKEQETKTVTGKIPVKEESPFTAIFEGVHKEMMKDKGTEFKVDGGKIFGPPKILGSDGKLRPVEGKSFDKYDGPADDGKDEDGYCGGGYDY